MILSRVQMALASPFLLTMMVCAVSPGVPSAAKAEDGADAAMAAWSASIGESLEASKLPVREDEGRALYKVCSECHRSNGLGHPDGTMPQLAGQHRSVLIKQMIDIRAGRRRNPAMYPYLARLGGPQALADVAAHIEKLPIPSDNGKGPGVQLARGKQLYDEHCASCHGASGEGHAEALYPKLTGQHYRYLVRQLIDIAGDRRANANPAMTAAIADFTARDVANVADYVSRLRPESEEAK